MSSALRLVPKPLLFMKLGGWYGQNTRLHLDAVLMHCSKIRVHNVNIHYEHVGSGGHPVLLLPGAAGTGRTHFAPQLEGLSHSKFTLIAWDPPGYGFSRPAQRNVDDFYSSDADIAPEFMIKLGFTKFSLIGWRDGGTTALVISARKPESVRKLVVFGACAYVTNYEVNLAEGFRDLINLNPKARAQMEDIYGKDYLSKIWNNHIDSYGYIYKTNNGDICKNEVKKIVCPTLVLHGGKDPFLAYEHTDYLVNNIKGAKLVQFPEGRHNIHVKYVKEFNKIVEDFLSA